MTNNLSSSRQTALTCLMRWHEGRSFAETLVDRECSQAALSQADRHLVQALVFGVLRNQTWLDHVIDSLRKGRLDMQLRLIIQLGLCQLFLLGMADHAAVYETVNLAPARLRGLVNAILRNALRREKSILDERERLPLPILYSTPAWLVKRWTRQLGPQTTRALLHWNNTTPRLYVRANPLIPMNGIPACLAPLDRAPGWFSLEGPLPLEEIKSGALYVADPSTRYAIDLLSPRAGEEILDACAAPGGKSAAIIAATGGKAHLTATDLHEHRLPTLKENLDRQGSTSVKTAQADWSLPCPPEWERHFDAVLLDVPCSNTGVIQRRVDVRWRLTPEEIRRLATLQKTILENASQAVKPGGRLVYSTCSIEAEEDGLLVREFLQNHPEWTLKEEKLILPHEEKSDGAYAALLICA
ncbi:transcription antitermination factor NusB [uncultured Akkermansia sp.]|uniref:RsmB/NOP family class I SAM-dependent RNA methyltransferase n=1 Tax=uncultured Akkermansia sp. TaxID=512294 RepID=UPI00265D5921|nr:transcription antitermination factor NusB [uncultured Akkermansia sp.]